MMPRNDKYNFENYSVAELIRNLIMKRGSGIAEKVAVSVGEDRLKEIIDGAELTLNEAIEISRALRVPLSVFEFHDPGSLPELEIAFADLAYIYLEMPQNVREAMVRDVMRLSGRWANARALFRSSGD
jgi:hypothetical protein